MTCTTNQIVPRESFPLRATGWIARLRKIVRTRRKSARKRPPIPNNRMVELSPHLLRDIGYSDQWVVRRRP